MYHIVRKQKVYYHIVSYCSKFLFRAPGNFFSSLYSWNMSSLGNFCENLSIAQARIILLRLMEVLFTQMYQIGQQSLYISFFLPLLHHGHHPHYIQHPDHDHSHPLSYIKGAHGHPHGQPRGHHGHPLILSPLWKLHISQSFRGDLDLIWLETLCLHLQCQIVTNGMMMGYLSNFDTLGTMLMTLG